MESRKSHSVKMTESDGDIYSRTSMARTPLDS